MDPREDSIGVSGVVSTSRKRRRLSPTCNKDSLEPITPASDVSSLNRQGRNVHISPEIHKTMECSSGGTNCNNGRFHLLAFGCNMYGQLINDPSWSIETNWKATEIHTDWLKNENADRDDIPAEPMREPNLFTYVDTPTVVMTARESLRVLYVGTNSICVERDGNIYLRGLLPTYASSNSEKLRELAISLPLGVEAHNVTKAFGTRWAFLGLILSDGRVCSFSLADWSFTLLHCDATRDPVHDIQVNRVGEICFLYSSSTEEYETGSSVIRIYPTIPSVSEHLYDASLQSFTLNTVSPISTFRLGSDQPDKGTLQDEKFTSISSTSTGFIALTSNGNIYTHGDKRFNSLGRSPDATISTDSNAQGWGQVTALEGIVIKYIGANPGGHVQGALAEDGTVYIWGGDGTENINVPLNSDSEDLRQDEEVTMVDITCRDNNEPVGFDGVYVGEDSVVLVEEGGEGIWVSGASDMGQTGFGMEYRCLPTALEIDEGIKRQKGVWRRLELGIPEGGMKIVHVSCGFGYTLILLDLDPKI
ncbi:hypothetical protein TWF506_003623 [Arthrobotrys conoides]|uniref:Uncharacterized protein n=1 Tax=Arthrobotrys conoides TaxID=74498 RepID=A0AAN8MXV4_9PEZI